MKSRVRADGLGRLNRSSAVRARRRPRRRGVRPPGGDAAPRDRVVHAFSYTEPGARLELATEPMVAVAHAGDRPRGPPHDVGGRPGPDAQPPPPAGPARSSRSPSTWSCPTGPPWCASAATAPTSPRSDRVRRSRCRRPRPGTGARSSTIVARLRHGGRADWATARSCVPIGRGWTSPACPSPGRSSAPPGWRVLDPGPGLIANDPDDPADWPCGPLGLWKPDWPLSDRPGDPDPAERLRQLDEPARPAGARVELSFAEWFSRWDSGPWPIVVDRLALGSAGLGPKSSCVPGRLAADRRDSARAASSSSMAWRSSPFPDALLITTESERPRFERQGPWLDAIAEAARLGLRSDRPVPVRGHAGAARPRRGAPRPRTSPPSGVRPLPGRITWRFSAPGWPGCRCLRPPGGRPPPHADWAGSSPACSRWRGWSCAGPGLRTPARPAGPGGRAPASCSIGSCPRATVPSTAGGFVGSLAILIAELARRTRRAPAPPPSGRPAPRAPSLRGAAGPAAVPVLVLASPASGPRFARRRPSAEAADRGACSPTRGPSIPTRPPDRVILRLEDFRRLTRRGATCPAPPDRRSPRCRRATASPGGASRISWWRPRSSWPPAAAGPSLGAMPVSSSRDISATLDGQPVPIAVEPGGDVATVVLPRAGNHLLRLRRWAGRPGRGGGRRGAQPAGQRHAHGAPDRRSAGRRRPPGRTGRRAAGSSRSPIDRWPAGWARPTGSSCGGRSRAARSPPVPSGPVEGLLLWDVTPAGDRLRARLTYHRTEEIAVGPPGARRAGLIAPLGPCRRRGPGSTARTTRRAASGS